MASFSEWFKAAHERNIPLESALPIDLPRDLERLNSSGLPTYDCQIISGESYVRNKQRVKDFCEKHNRVWTRVYNKMDRNERYSRFDLRGYKNVADFVEGLDINLKKFDIQLFEFHTNQFGGNILTNSEGTKIEIAEGTQDIVGKCLGPFFSGWISPFGTLEFSQSDSPEKVRSTAWRVLQQVKMAKGEYVPGYFEFIVSDKGKVYFLDYKTDLKFNWNLNISKSF